MAGEFWFCVEHATVTALPEAGVIGARTDEMSRLHVVVEILRVGESLVADIGTMIPVAEILSIRLQCCRTLKSTMTTAVGWLVH